MSYLQGRELTPEQMNELQEAQAEEWPRDELLTRWEQALRHERLLLVKAPRRNPSVL